MIIINISQARNLKNGRKSSAFMEGIIKTNVNVWNMNQYYKK